LYNEEEKAIGATWHEGLCNTYKCSLNAEGHGMIILTKTECAECAPDEQKEFVANRCCPICRKPVPTTKTPEIPKRPPTPTETCSDVMTDPLFMDEKRVTLQPADKGRAEDLQSTGKGWSPLISDKPSVTLTVTSDNGKEPNTVKSITVEGNVAKVTIEVLFRTTVDAPSGTAA
jgi:hypothetical protein